MLPVELQKICLLHWGLRVGHLAKEQPCSGQRCREGRRVLASTASAEFPGIDNSRMYMKCLVE